MKRAISAAIVLILLISTASASSTVHIDADNPLDEPDAIAEYEENETVTRTIDRYSLSITVSKSNTFDSVSAFKPWSTWVRVSYDENIPRTFRIYVPKEYFYPVPKNNHPSLSSDVTADFVPVRDRNYTSITVRFDGKNNGTYAVSGGFVLEAKDSVRSLFERELSIEIPTLVGTGHQWTNVSKDRFQNGNTSVRIPVNGTVMVQYLDNSRWIRVPPCQSGGNKMCRVTKNSSVYVVSLTSDPHKVRYKQGSDYSSAVDAAVNQLQAIPEKLGNIVSSILDGIL